MPQISPDRVRSTTFFPWATSRAIVSSEIDTRSGSRIIKSMRMAILSRHIQPLVRLALPFHHSPKVFPQRLLLTPLLRTRGELGCCYTPLPLHGSNKSRQMGFSCLQPNCGRNDSDDNDECDGDEDDEHDDGDDDFFIFENL